MPVRPWWYDKWWQGEGLQKDTNGVGGDYAQFEYSRPWYITARWLLKVIIIAILISVGGLTAYHWFDGADIADAFKLTTWDVRFVTKCYEAPSTIPKFIQVNNAGNMTIYVTLGGETVDNYLSRNCIELRREPPAASTDIPGTDIPDQEVRTKTAEDDVGQRLSESRLAELRLFTLQLINKDRADHGLPPVALGSNPAAQSHAEDMLVHGYQGHWWVDGRKPYMVYSETRGQSYASENVASRGWTQEEWDAKHCGSSLVICARSEPKEAIEDLEFWMMYNDAHADWGHRDNILGNTHRFVNIGIAWDGRRTALAQHFEGGDVVANGRPALSADGTLSFRLTKVAEDIEVGALVTVFYDPPPSPKTPAQIDALDRYCIGGGLTAACDHKPVARILEPPGPAFYYPKLDPNEVVADSWSQSSTSFEFTASLGSRATRPGVYTVMVWQDSGSPFLSDVLVALSVVQP